jgi:hypothetical protein
MFRANRTILIKRLAVDFCREPCGIVFINLTSVL